MKTLRILAVIIVVITLLYVVYNTIYKFFEQNNINFISKEATLRIRNYLNDLKKGEQVLDRIDFFNIQIPLGYTNFNVELISARRICDSEFIVETVHYVSLFYSDKIIKYEVTQTFTRFLGVQFRYTKEDINDGVWATSWIQLSS